MADEASEMRRNLVGVVRVRAGEAPAVAQRSLREALRHARDLFGSGFSVMHIVKLPNDAIFVSSTQVRRLWEALGMQRLRH